MCLVFSLGRFTCLTDWPAREASWGGMPEAGDLFPEGRPPDSPESEYSPHTTSTRTQVPLVTTELHNPASYGQSAESLSVSWILIAFRETFWIASSLPSSFSWLFLFKSYRLHCHNCYYTDTITCILCYWMLYIIRRWAKNNIIMSLYLPLIAPPLPFYFYHFSVFLPLSPQG